MDIEDIIISEGMLPTMTQCAVFKGTTKGTFIDKREYVGSIQEQQEEAFQFVLRNIRLGARIKGLYRQDVYEIPPDAIREILVDAVVHRSYLATGNIQVAPYDNRLEVMTPGKLPMDQTIETMKTGFSKIRNEAIAKAFAYMGLIEGWGNGIPKVNSLLKEAGLKEMEISGGDFFVKFVIYRNLNFDPSATNDNVGVESENVGVKSKNVGVEPSFVGVKSENVGVEPSVVGVDDKSAILNIIRENPHITAKELATRLHITTRTTERIFRQLKQCGRIRREGSDRYGSWIIID